MSHVYKSIDLVGASEQGFEDAVRIAVKRAGETMRKLQWLEVLEQRAALADGDVREYQVKIRVWFTLED